MQDISLERIASMVEEAKDLSHVRLTTVKQAESYYKRKDIFFQINLIRTTHDLTCMICKKVTGYNYCTFVWVKKYNVEKISTEKATEILERLRTFIHLKDKYGFHRAVSICEEEVAKAREARLQPGSCCSNSPKELETKKVLFTYFQNLAYKKPFSIRELADACETSTTTIHYALKNRYGKISIKTLGTIISRLENHI